MKNIKFYSYSLFTVLVVLLLTDQFRRIYSVRKSTQQDMDFIHQTIFDNHPGVYNDQDSEFVRNMNKAYSEAKSSINSIRSLQDQKNIIKRYLDSFNDSHLRFYSANQKSTSVEIKDNQSFMIKEIFDQVVWIILPTFMPDSTQQKELESIIKKMPEYRTYKMIVFDVRSNTGGNSVWGTKIIQSLFGKEYADRLIYNMNQQIKVDWRASKDNVEYLKSLVNQIIDQFGAESLEAAEFQVIAQGLQQAYQDDKVFYTEHTSTQLTSKVKLGSSVTAKTVIIISSHCVSACLDFIDELKAVDPAVVLIGEVTGADSIYMEVRTVDLPSGIGKLQFPIKMYRNRPRGHNVPYVPDMSYPQNVNLSQDRDSWLLNVVKKLSK